MAKQVPRCRTILELLREENSLLPFLGLGIPPANPHQRHELGLLPSMEPLYLFANLFTGEVAAAVLQDISHLVVDRV